MAALSPLLNTYLHPRWPFRLVVISSLIGVAPWINALLYHLKWPYVFWAMVIFWSQLRFVFSIFFWILAIGFFIIGRKDASGKYAPEEPVYATGKSESSVAVPIFHDQEEPVDCQAASESALPKNALSRPPSIHVHVAILLSIALTILVLCSVLSSLPAAIFIAQTSAYKDSISYQGHVYHLVIEEKQQEGTGSDGVIVTFAFTVFRCDLSGAFCHVFHDGLWGTAQLFDWPSHPYVYNEVGHLEMDSSRSQLLGFSGHERKFAYPLP